MSALKRFLSRNSVKKSEALPIVHSTSAYSLVKILQKRQIDPSPCDVFLGEDLSYFFVGRPAYKKQGGGEAEYWELPACVIMNYDVIKPKRIYPFDSGAFEKHLYPDFISLMDKSEFEVGDVSDAPQRMIGAFFVNADRYFRLQPRQNSSFNREFEPDMLDMEVKALYKLVLAKTGAYDDRRFAIEMQYNKSLTLNKKDVLAIIFPEEFCESEEFMGHVKRLGADSIPYQSFPIKREYYYYAIYQQIYEYYKRKGYIK